MRVVHAEKKHIKEISNLLKDLENKKVTLSEKEYICPLFSKNNLYILLDKNKIVGVLGLSIQEKSCEIVYIVSHIKKGGTTLIKFAENLCKSKKIPKIWTWSLIGYHALDFYNKLGFNEQYLLKKQWFGEDCYYFGKLIS